MKFFSKVAALAGMLLAFPASGQTGEAWRGIEGVWQVARGDARCPDGSLWTFAYSDDGRRLALWTQGYLQPPITIPDRLGDPPRIQGKRPFSNTRIISRRGPQVRTNHGTMTVTGTRLMIDLGNFRCHAIRVRG